MTKEWWYPVLCDKAYLNQLRKDYPEKADGLDDDDLLDYFNDGRKYQCVWDHIGDAYEDWEPLAESYLRLEKALQDIIDMDSCLLADAREIAKEALDD